MAHFLCHLGCSHFGALLLDFYFTENTLYGGTIASQFGGIILTNIIGWICA